MPYVKVADRIKEESLPTSEDLFEVNSDELDDVIAGLPTDDATISVYRINPLGQGRSIFVATYLPGDFSLERIQENHGGGKFSLLAKRGREVVKRMRVELEGEPIIKGRVPQNLRTPDGYHRWLNKVELDEETQKARTLGSDPALLMLLTEIRNMKDSLQTAKPAAHDRREFLEELVMYKNLFSAPANPMADNSKMISDLLQKGLEIGANAANGEAPGGGWIGIIRELLPVAQQAISAAINKQNVMIARSTPNSVNGNGTPEITLNKSGLGDILPIMRQEEKAAQGFFALGPMLKTYLPLIVATAARDGNPEGVAETIGANISEQQKPHVVEWLQGETWFADLVGLDPRIELQSAWWSELQGCLLAGLTGQVLENSTEES